ncbi:MAG TPA: hypothetical protein VJA21_04980 [Verrucomicrobiae bacterium]
MKPKTITQLLLAVSLSAGWVLFASKSRGQGILSIGETLNCTNLTWTLGGDPWFVQTATTHDGEAALMWTGDSSYTEGWLETTVTGRTAVAFWGKTECCGSGDSPSLLEYYAGTNLQGSMTGITDWQRHSFLVPDEGPQTVRWRIRLGCVLGSTSVANENAAWLDEVSLEAPRAPSTSSEPTNQTVSAGRELLLSAEVAGTEPMSYQWTFFSTNLPSATNTLALLYDVQEANAGEYRLIASNALGTITSAVALVTVNPNPPFITRQPVGFITPHGSNVTLSAWARGTQPICWQWYFHGQQMPGETNTILALRPAETNYTGDYTVVAWNDIGAATSQVATLLVTTVPLITQQPLSQAAPPGASAFFTAEVSGPAPLRYLWFSNGVQVADQGYAFFGVPNVRTQSYGDYWLVVTNLYGSSTSAVATLSYSPVRVWGSDCKPVPPQASSLLMASGGSWHAMALTSDHTVLAWPASSYANRGETNVPDGLANVVSIAAGDSHSVALRDDGTVVSWGKLFRRFYLGGSAEVTNQMPEWATNIIALAQGPRAGHILVLREDGMPVSWGDSSGGLLDIPASATNIISVAAGGGFSLALRSDGTIIAWGRGLAPGQTNVPSAATNCVAIAAGEDFCAALRADGRVVAWGNGVPGMTNVPAQATNVTGIACGLRQVLALRSDRKLVVWGWDNVGSLLPPANATNLVGIAGLIDQGLGLVGDGPPFIMSQPISTAGRAGDTLRFLCSAGGALPLAYQWCEDGAPVAGMTNAWLLISNLQPQENSAYTMVVSNSFGMVTSRVARVIGVYPSEPRIVALPSVVPVPSNTTARVTVTAYGSEPLGYQWRRSETNILNDERVTGADSATLRIFGFRSSDQGSYRVLVTNPWGSATSSVVNVRLTYTPSEDLNEALDTPGLGWSYSGYPTWICETNVTADGEDAAQSPQLAYRGSAQISTTIRQPCAVFFWWKVSSQTNGGLLAFNANGQTVRISGEVDWQQRSFALTNTLFNPVTWTYTNGSSVTAGQNCGWLDQVSFGAPVAPVITQQPASGAAIEGSNFLFTVTASGTEPFSYQWRLNGTNLFGKSTASLNLSTTGSGDAGDYSVVVLGPGGSITSSVAQLTVVSSAARAYPRIALAPSGSLQIIWDSGTLQSAAFPDGPWTDVPGARSPLVLLPEGATRYFRVRFP